MFETKKALEFFIPTNDFKGQPTAKTTSYIASEKGKTAQKTLEKIDHEEKISKTMQNIAKREY
jgi:hypothetical protein